MNDDSLEISSKQLRHELQQIKERLTTIESIEVHLRRDEILKLVEDALEGKPEWKKILKYCDEPRTIVEIQTHLGKNSRQAIGRHINPLHDQAWLEKTETDEGLIAFVRSRILTRLVPSDLRRVLDEPDF